MTRQIQLILMTLLLLMAAAGSYLGLEAASPRPRFAAPTAQATSTPPPIDVPSPPAPPVACCERPIGYPPRAEQLPTPAAAPGFHPYPYPEPHGEVTR
jgi:hypothetical protein